MIGALVLGVAETLTATYISPAWSTAVPYLVIFVVLLRPPAGPARRAPARGRAPHERAGCTVPRRGRRALRRSPLAAAALPGRLPDNLYYQNMIILSLVFAIGAVGLNIITGYAGYVSLGQGAFLGLGALHGRRSSRRTSGRHRRWLWVPVGGVVAAVVRARCSASVALRTRGPSFVIITIAFLFLLQIVATNWKSLTNGSDGHHAAAADLERRHPELAVLLRAAWRCSRSRC